MHKCMINNGQKHKQKRSRRRSRRGRKRVHTVYSPPILYWGGKLVIFNDTLKLWFRTKLEFSPDPL